LEWNDAHAAFDSLPRLLGAVDNRSMVQLPSLCDKLVKEGTQRVHVMISAPGGSVVHGVSVCTYLQGLPVELVTHNFGAVDSMGLIVFSAGKTRRSVANARFLIHPVTTNIQGPANRSEDRVREILKRLPIDAGHIARIIAEPSNKTEKEVHVAMHGRTTLDPQPAVAFGLVDRIEPLSIPHGAMGHAIHGSGP
jgi:ATP-dependent Clp protease, protease subunit